MIESIYNRSAQSRLPIPGCFRTQSQFDLILLENRIVYEYSTGVYIESLLAHKEVHHISRTRSHLLTSLTSIVKETTAIAPHDLGKPYSSVTSSCVMFNMIGGAIKTRWENAKGRLSLKEGDLSAAMKFFQEALRIAKENDPSSLLAASCYNNIGVVLYHRGDLDGALEQYQRALAIEEVKAPKSLAIAASYHNIGTVLKHKGDLDGALE